MDYKNIIVSEMLYNRNQTVLKRLYIPAAYPANPYDGFLSKRIPRPDIAYRAKASESFDQS